MEAIQGGKAEQPALDDLRRSLTAGEKKIVRAVVAQYERDLIEALPELNAGVNTADAEGSFSSTLSVKAGKRGRFKGMLAPRVRVPKEKTEFDFHLNDDGQLDFGLPSGWQDEPTGSGSAGEE